MRIRNQLKAITIYLAVFLSAISFAVSHSDAQSSDTPASTTAASSTGSKDAKNKPYFSLSTNRTYSTADRARIWINYVSIDSLDFRVYRVDDPSAFFRQLANPHRMGEQERI